MGRRSTGASTRPAPAPGVGFDHDKLDRVALEDHFDNYYGKLLKRVGPRAKHGWTTVHLDSLEMGAQNWTPKFREEFMKRRGYDAQPYFVTFSGRAVKSVEVSERFLWDVRMTAQELVLENYAGHLKTLGHEHGFELSIEPYDMNPCADLDLVVAKKHAQENAHKYSLGRHFCITIALHGIYCLGKIIDLVDIAKKVW